LVETPLVMEKHAVSAAILKKLLCNIADPLFVIQGDPVLNPGTVSVLLQSTYQ